MSARIVLNYSLCVLTSAVPPSSTAVALNTGKQLAPKQHRAIVASHTLVHTMSYSALIAAPHTDHASFAHHQQLSSA